MKLSFQLVLVSTPSGEFLTSQKQYYILKVLPEKNLIVKLTYLDLCF
jgi:hypothetical protein